jgi:uncharacterized membrane protein
LAFSQCPHRLQVREVSRGSTAITFWIGWNLAPRARHFDPFPFNLLGVVVSCEAVILSSFILIT